MIANLLSLSRVILGILFLFVASNKFLALFVIIIGGLTDAFDGFFARKYGKTKHGSLIDAGADRIFSLSIIIGLVFHYQLSILYGILMSTRDIVTGIILPLPYIFKKIKTFPKTSIFNKVTAWIITLSFIFIVLDFYSKLFIFIAVCTSILVAIYSLKLYFPNS